MWVLCNECSAKEISETIRIEKLHFEKRPNIAPYFPLNCNDRFLEDPVQKDACAYVKPISLPADDYHRLDAIVFVSIIDLTKRDTVTASFVTA